jgi:transcriptional regulator with XRE-family HTH domain
MTPLRNCRLAVGMSQAEFAARLGASVETYRTWDSGRRPTPVLMLEKALQWSEAAAGNQLLSLPRLAAILGVHVRTLRRAAKDGRLEVEYGNRTLFGNPIPRATLAAAYAFMLLANGQMRPRVPASLTGDREHWPY